MALVSIVHSITSLPEEFRTAIEIASCEHPSRYTSRCPLGRSFEVASSQALKPTPKRAPLYIASAYRTCTGLVLHAHPTRIRGTGGIKKRSFYFSPANPRA